MSYILNWCRTALLAALLLLPTAVAAAAPDIMPVDDIKPGMQGIGKTVVSGNKIEDFNVEVLGIMKDKGPAGDLILVRTYGDVIDRTGGIAEGMSGSPIYIDGKLVGAIAYGWPLADHKVGMVTPIGDMMKLWNLPTANQAVSLQLPSGEQETVEPLATPVMASGLSSEAFSMLKDKLKPFNLVPYDAGGTSGSGGDFGPLEPGGAIGAELVRGDVSLAAIGTVTYVDGDKVLAFGHPFLNRGQANYFMSNAYIYATVNGLQSPFKVGTTGQLLGTLDQDRGAGIAGTLARFPSNLPIRITVQDNTLQRTQDMAVQIVDDEQLAPALTAVSTFNAIQKTMDRVGAGTARVSFEILAKDMPGDVLKRENMFYSADNIGQAAIAEVFEAVGMLSANPFNHVDIMDVKVNVTVDNSRQTASIIEARAENTAVKPGDKVNVWVTLEPYRDQSIKRMLSYTIPQDQPAGPLTLDIHGGGSLSLAQLLLRQQGIDPNLMQLVKVKPQTFADVIKEFARRDHNNDVVAEPLNIELSGLGGEGAAVKAADTKAVDNGKTPKQANNASLSGDAFKTDDRSKASVSTDYIIDGSAQVTVNVVK